MSCLASKSFSRRFFSGGTNNDTSRGARRRGGVATSRPAAPGSTRAWRPRVRRDRRVATRPRVPRGPRRGEPVGARVDVGDLHRRDRQRQRLVRDPRRAFPRLVILTFDRNLRRRARPRSIVGRGRARARAFSSLARIRRHGRERPPADADARAFVPAQRRALHPLRDDATKSGDENENGVSAANSKSPSRLRRASSLHSRFTS